MSRIFEFNELESADLIVDATYKGGTAGNAGDDPIHKLLGCGTQGGFRYIGPAKATRMVVIYSSLQDTDWPDTLDEITGQFTYWGDNKKPGHALHDTPRKGNEILRKSFEDLHLGMRDRITPFFVFTKGSLGRDVVFRGLAVPGGTGLSSTEDLVAVWKSKNGERFQNYRAIFAILDIPVITRTWLSDVKNRNVRSLNCPSILRKWIENGIYAQLRAERTIQYRTKEEQLPSSIDDRKIIETIHLYFETDPYRFEKCAGELVRLMDSNIVSIDLTRPWVDGGRDALGKYRIGLDANMIEVEFALEAKCWRLDNAVRVKDTSRLISRLRYRQFGIFVTTSFIHRQAYKEIKEDQHPVIIVCAKDIVRILKDHGYSSPRSVKEWLEKYFPA
jgi:hypothetical protein